MLNTTNHSDAREPWLEKMPRDNLPRETLQRSFWRALQVPYPHNQGIHHLFEAQVERSPERVAVVYEDTQLTYRQLNERANQLAHYLRRLGVGPEVLVGFSVERSLEMVVGLLGILKAGGAYLPLDPGYPEERLAFMLEDSQAPVLLTQHHLLPQFPQQGAKVACLDAERKAIARQSTANLTSSVQAEQLAYVIYTSGSTGKPKGVQILQRSLVNFMLSMLQQPGLSVEDTLLAVTTYSFDIAALELFLPLLVGGRVVVVSRETAADGPALAEALAQSRATVMQATPATWRLLLACGWQGHPSMKLLCGGEALSRDLAQQLLKRCGSLWNLYGPTETTIWSTVRQITPDDTGISIGRPIANTEVYLLDQQLQVAPAGVAAELYIGGDGLARGYLNRPELTAERFIAHPFSPEPGARLYRTGDLARCLPNGEIEHLGRLDHQVKIRGFRIEPGEIEAALQQHPMVREAVVVAREDTLGEKRLVAYVVPARGEASEAGTLRSFLKAHLPNFMIPAIFMFIEALPLTPTRKVDRQALPAPEALDGYREQNLTLPHTPTEEHLAQIWEELLGHKQVGINENFFELGGHSLLAGQLLARIQAQFQIDFALASFFEAPTIAELALKIVQKRAELVDAQLADRLLDELEQLSENEAQTILASGSEGANAPFPAR